MDTVENIYSVLPPAPIEEYNSAIESLNSTTQVMQDQIFEMDGVDQANTPTTSTNTMIMAQTEQLPIAMVEMQTQLKAMSYTRTKAKDRYYCWRYGSKN